MQYPKAARIEFTSLWLVSYSIQKQSKLAELYFARYHAVVKTVQNILYSKILSLWKWCIHYAFQADSKLGSLCVGWQDQTKEVDCLIHWLFIEYPREKVARPTDLENFREQSLHIQLAKKVNWLIHNQHGAFIDCSVMNTINIGGFVDCSVIISDSLKKGK